jgi:serine/threonine protein kinase
LTIPVLRKYGYEDVTVVGAGGLGDVYRARRVSTGGSVAIKVVREHGDRESTDRRVRRELEALLRLKGHPNVVQIEELIELPTGLALVMEFVGGGSLMDLLGSSGPLSPARAVAAMADVTRALSDAHAVGIVHRDIKPHNVMVGQFGQCKVCDFGIAAVLKDTAYTDRTSALSYRYASPEELQDSPEIGPATDVYSLGVTLRQLLTGETSEARMAAGLSLASADGSLTIAGSGALRSLGELVAHMTARDPLARPTAAAALQFVRDIERALGEERAGSVLADQQPPDAPDADSTVVRRPTSAQTAAQPAAFPPPAGPQPAQSPVSPAADTGEGVERTVVRPRTAPPPGPPTKVLPNPHATPERWWE